MLFLILLQPVIVQTPGKRVEGGIEPNAEGGQLLAVHDEVAGPVVFFQCDIGVQHPGKPGQPAGQERLHQP